MPRIPDIDALGARPIPRSQRSIARVRNASAVADAVGGLGETISQIGGRMQEKEDRLAYATAKSNFLKGLITARQELEADPDYETWETRFDERVERVRGEAAGRIGSRSDRSQFEADAELEIVRFAGDLANGARARRVDSEIAGARETLSGMQDLAQDAVDDGARESVIGNAGELISGLRQKGYISAQEEVTMRRDWTQNYVVQRIETLRNAEDFDGALRFFESNRGRLDSATESRVANLLTDATQNREALILAEEFVRGTAPGTPAAANDDTTEVPASAPEMVRNFEGFRESTYWDVNHHRVGYGSDTITTARGEVRRVRQGDRVSRADAERDLNRRLAELNETAAQRAGDGWAQLPESAKAAVVSVAYNYGAAHERLKPLWAAAASGDADAVATVIETFANDNNGVNRSRRLQEASVARNGTVVTGPQRHDLRQINAGIDARAEAEGWTPEKTERIKAQAARLVSRDDALLDREQADAYESALAKAETLGDEFTDPSQLGDAYYRASETQQRTLRSMAEANLRAATAATEAEANGDVIRALHRMQIEAPGQFVGTDLRPYRPFMTPGEYDEAVTSQARARQEAGQWSPRTGIQAAITWGEKFGGVELDNDEDRFRVYRYMEDRARQFRAESNGRQPAESDYQRWFGEVAAEVPVTRSFAGIDILAPDASPRAFETVAGGAVRRQIERNFRAVNGRDPTEAEIQQWFERMGEAIR